MTTELDPVAVWLEKEIAPAIQESSTLLYEFSRLELRDIVQSHEMLLANSPADLAASAVSR